MKTQVVICNFQEAKILLGQLLQGPQLPQTQPDCANGLLPACASQAAAGAEPELRSFSPDQLLQLVEDGLSHSGGCALMLFSMAAGVPGVATPAVATPPVLAQGQPSTSEETSSAEAFCPPAQVVLPPLRPECLASSWLRGLYAVLEKNLANPAFTVDFMAGQLAMSPKSLLRKVKALLHASPKEVMQQYRLGRAAQLLRDGYRVGEVADSVGFNSATHFGQCFKKIYSMTPSQYAAQAEAGAQWLDTKDNGLESKGFCLESEHRHSVAERNIALSIHR